VSATHLKKNWVMTQDAFNLLLACLDHDQQRAGQKYEDLRRGLIVFFESRGSSSPQDLADDTINRVARRLAEGREIYVENPASYFYGVARNVLKEHWESAHPSSAALENLPPSKHPSSDPGRLELLQLERNQKERRLECLEHCLEALMPGDRQLIYEYYQGETGTKVQNRKTLADRIGIPLNALRIRALRIREKLEACVERRLKELAGE